MLSNVLAVVPSNMTCDQHHVPCGWHANKHVNWVLEFPIHMEPSPRFAPAIIGGGTQANCSLVCVHPPLQKDCFLSGNQKHIPPQVNAQIVDLVLCGSKRPLQLNPLVAPAQARQETPRPTCAYCRRDATMISSEKIWRMMWLDGVNLGGQLEGRTCKLRSDCVAQDGVALSASGTEPPTEDLIIAASEELWCELALLSPRGRCRPPVQSPLRLSVPHETRFHVRVRLHILALR